MRLNLLSLLLVLISLDAFSQVPAITSFAPKSGPVGTTVTINGNNFNTALSANIVSFGATNAKVIAATKTQLTVTVPLGATYQPIAVLNSASGRTAFSTVPFVATFTSKHSVAGTDFDSPQRFSTGGTGPIQVVAADLDGDGKTDVIAADRDAGNIAVFFNTSTNTGSISSGSFAAPFTLSGSGDPVAVVLGDLNGDGLPDIVVENQNSRTISVYINTSTAGAIAFQTPFDLVIGEVVQATAISQVTLSDLDRDGRLDIIATTNAPYGQTVSVLRNTAANGILSFGKEVNFAGGNNVTSLNAADLDGDGLPELVMTNDRLAILQNMSTSGHINFTSVTSIVTNGTPVTACIGDLDQDGKPDIVVANPGPFSGPQVSTFSIYRNISAPGSITLATPVDFTAAVPYSYQLCISDMDGDGLPDVASIAGSGVQILRNITAGNNITLAGPVSVTGIASGAWLALGDINGDGMPDLITADFGFGSFDVFTNDPQNPPANLPPTISSVTPEMGDVGATVTINGTNFNAGAAGNSVFFGATKATVSAATSTKLTVKVPAGATYQPLSVLNTSTHLTGYPDSPFLPTFAAGARTVDYDPKVDLPAGNSPNSVAIGDIDGDGKPDIVVANLHGNSISIFRNISTGGTIKASSFATKVDFATLAGPVFVRIGDINGDGKPDIIVGCGGSNNITILRNSSSPGNITMEPSISFFQNTPVQDLQIADIDGDGLPDIIAAINGAPIAIFLNRSVGGNIDKLSFIQKDVGSTTDAPMSLSVADIDGDGKPDIVVGAMGANTSSISIFRNTSTSGNPSFAPAIVSSAGNWPETAGISDIDGDGKPDVVLSMQGPYGVDGVAIFPNISTAGNISFGPSVYFQTGNSTRALAIGDLDGDGKPDVMVVNSQDNTVSVLNNTSTSGNISFSPKMNFAAGNYPEAVTIGDLDGDGKPDVITANGLGNTVSVLHYNANPIKPPAIISAYLIGATGTFIDIVGLNLSGATAVSFGGVPAASFIVNSSTEIVAVVAAGKTGNIKVTTPSGIASVSGFTFVPVPKINYSGPTVLATGGTLLLTAMPDTGGYTYQWLKDGYNINGATSPAFTVTQSGSYSVKLIYFSVSQVSSQTVNVVVQFNLPPANFTITAVSATCNSSNNGKIDITAAQSMAYNYTVSGSGAGGSGSFTTEAVINNLSPGTYHVCITVNGEPDYQQCYDVVITEPKALSLYSTINDADKTITLALSGGTQYNVTLNGVLHTTGDNTITLPLAEGDNALVVTTDKLCQGIIQKLIKISGKIIPYPVPFQNTLNFNLGNNNINNVSVEIHNVTDGRLVYSKQLVNQSGVLQLDVAGLTNGVYAFHITMGNSEKLFKIIKK